MWQKDLLPDTYGRKHPDPKVLAWGWLEEGHDFFKGETSEEVIKFLEGLPVGNLYRGSHNCDYCPKPPKGVPYNYKDYPSGNGDIRVDLDGITYVAPKLVLHYIKEHGYRVPSVIQQGILAGKARPGKYAW